MAACAYCGKARGIHQDHVVPKSYRKKTTIPDALAGTVPACMTCNVNKMNRRLVPQSWKPRLPELEAAYPGTPWRCWDGDTKSPAYRDTHL